MHIHTCTYIHTYTYIHNTPIDAFGFHTACVCVFRRLMCYRTSLHMRQYVCLHACLHVCLLVCVHVCAYACFYVSTYRRTNFA